jgi:hypothetical protein
LGIKSVGAAVKAFIDKEDKDAVNVIVENQVLKLIFFANICVNSTNINEDNVTGDIE